MRLCDFLAKLGLYPPSGGEHHNADAPRGDQLIRYEGERPAYENAEPAVEDDDVDLVRARWPASSRPH